MHIRIRYHNRQIIKGKAGVVSVRYLVKREDALKSVKSEEMERKPGRLTWQVPGERLPRVSRVPDTYKPPETREVFANFGAGATDVFRWHDIHGIG